MNTQLVVVLLCVAVAAFFVGRRFVRVLRRRGCACESCGKANSNCCDASGCPSGNPGEQAQKSITELRPR